MWCHLWESWGLGVVGPSNRTMTRSIPPNLPWLGSRRSPGKFYNGRQSPDLNPIENLISVESLTSVRKPYIRLETSNTFETCSPFEKSESIWQPQIRLKALHRLEIRKSTSKPQLRLQTLHLFENLTSVWKPYIRWQTQILLEPQICLKTLHMFE